MPGTAAHPRLRGADGVGGSFQVGEYGSSPLTRGGLPRHARPTTRPGLIPAYAGRTSMWTRSTAAGWAHPRLRGADIRSETVLITAWGSSPLTRGGHIIPEVGVGQRGLIPAYAGRTRCWIWRLVTGWAHPRLRGADGLMWRPRLVCMGSSPLTRGGLSGSWVRHCHMGLIPAYAGRTDHTPTVEVLARAHPRLRGADSHMPAYVVCSNGSSPLTRGGPSISRSFTRPCRLIPAYAGRTQLRLSEWRKNGAHPRLRGADPLFYTWEQRRRGSSPLTRGGLGRCRCGCGRRGLIPAYAGRTESDNS